MSWWINVSREDWRTAVEVELPRMQKTQDGKAVYPTTFAANRAKEAALGLPTMVSDLPK